MLYTPVDVSDTDTYNEQQAACVAKGMKLCTLDQLCPTQGGLGFDIPGYLGDSWIAYDGTDNCGCVDNAWVQIGIASNACKTHCEVTGEFLGNAICPAWGADDNDVAYIPNAYVCCAL